MGLKGAALQSKAVCSFIVISQWIIGFMRLSSSWQDTSGPNVTYSRAGRGASTARFHT